MSTRIFNGFLLRDVTTLQVVHRMVTAFRPKVLALAEAKLDNLVAHYISNNPGTAEGTAWRAIWREREARVGRSEQMPGLDFQFQLAFIPSEVGMLGMAYCENSEWYKAWCAETGVEEFSYSNQADKPDSISEKDWKFRAQCWDAITVEPISVQSYAIDLITEHQPYPKHFRKAF